MNYSEHFKRLVLDAGFHEWEERHCRNIHNLIGWGNPNAKILLLGKEPAIDMTTDSGRNQYSTEVEWNRSDWCRNIENNTGFDDVFNEFADKRIYGNPLYPHCWQKYGIRIRRNGILSNGDGTARTWYQYQKLIDMILGRQSKAHDLLDFHKFCFSTDLSDNAGLNMRLDRAETEVSIDKRRALFRSDFFRSFPVVIAAVGNYKDYLDLEAFGVCRSRQEKTEVDNASFTIRVNDDCGTPHLVVVSRQFAAPISDGYLRSIAGKVNEFAVGHNIDLIPDSI